MTEIEQIARRAKSLIAMCYERGLPAPYVSGDVDEILKRGSKDPLETRASLQRVVDSCHELLYAPPK